MFGTKRPTIDETLNNTASLGDLPHEIDAEPVADEQTFEPSTAARLFKQAPSQILKPSIISEGFELVGDIKSSGGLHVEGKINGKIQVDNLTIGGKGMVAGSAICKTLHIKGKFEGDASCDVLNLSGDAVVKGDVEYHSLTMSSGTILIGNLKKK